MKKINPFYEEKAIPVDGTFKELKNALIEEGNKYYDMTKGTGYPTDVRRYMSKLKILDDGLGVLLEGLESRGILDDTVIVMFGDHYPYGIKTDELQKLFDYDLEVNMEVYQMKI